MSRGDASRQRILDAATELFAQKGYAGTGVNELAERSGIAKSALYHHFGSKAGLLAAALERAVGSWIEAIAEVSRQAGDWQARLDAGLTGMRVLLEEKPWIFKLIQILALEVADEQPEIRTMLQSVVARARHAIASGMRDALGTDVPGAETVASVILAVLDGVALGREIDPDGVSLDDAFAELRRITTFLVAARLHPELGLRIEEAAFD